MTEIRLPRTNEHISNKDAEGDFRKIYEESTEETEVV
jgi:hypothetical protein